MSADPFDQFARRGPSLPRRDPGLRVELEGPAAFRWIRDMPWTERQVERDMQPVVRHGNDPLLCTLIFDLPRELRAKTPLARIGIAFEQLRQLGPKGVDAILEDRHTTVRVVVEGDDVMGRA